MQSGVAVAASEASFVRYVPMIRRVLASRLGSDPDVPDLQQDVLFLAWRRVHELRNPQGVASWLGTTAWLLAHGRMRQRRRQRQIAEVLSVSPTAAASSDDFEARQSLRAVQQVLSRMREQERRVFELRVIDGLTLLQIGEACDISLGTVKRRLQRAQQAFVKGALREPILARRLARTRSNAYGAPPPPQSGICSQTGV